MTRYMVNCTGENATTVHGIFPHPEMVAWYGTGTPDIMWTDAERALFTGATMVEIDQGHNSPQITTATVRDVETGAWPPAEACQLTHWETERPTIYCSDNTLTQVIAAGWHGDVWLALPGFDGTTPPARSGVNIVAVQNIYATSYQESIVFDDTWPNAIQEVQQMLNVQIPSSGKAMIPFPAGSFRTIHLYRDFLSETDKVSVRLAAHSAAGGYEVRELVLASDVPTVFTFAESDTDAVSLIVQTAGYEIGATLA